MAPAPQGASELWVQSRALVKLRAPASGGPGGQGPAGRGTRDPKACCWLNTSGSASDSRCLGSRAPLVGRTPRAGAELQRAPGLGGDPDTDCHNPGFVTHVTKTQGLPLIGDTKP